MSINREIAAEEVKAWLQFKRIRPRKIEENKEFQEQLIDCVQDEIFTIDEETKKIEFTLQVPVDGLTKLTFKPRLFVWELNSALKGAKSTDADARILAYIAALTGENTKLIEKMATEDYSVCQAIVMYFL